MIGPYSQFKGKLKAGDRVRVEYGGRTSLGEVNETSESGFTVRENMDEWRCVERFIFWTSEGTLELLSPSPRVVTDTEAPSLPLIAKFTVKAKGSVDYNNIIKMTNPTDKDVYAMVWDASPPAPAEKEEEWWEDSAYWDYESDEYRQPLLGRIVTEAKRRGADEALKHVEAGFMECDTCRAKPGTPTLCRGCQHNRAVLDVLSPLTKPVTPGEE